MNRKRYAFILSLSISIISIIPSQANANIFISGGRLNGYQDAYFDWSVASYGYTSYLDDGIRAWNGITPKVLIGWTNTTTNYPDKYFVGDTDTANVCGMTIPFKKVANDIVRAEPYENWLYSNISIYDNTIKKKNLSSNHIRYGVAAHEVGHSLALAHNTSTNKSIMTEVITLNDFPPTQYDKSELISKWGK